MSKLSSLLIALVAACGDDASSTPDAMPDVMPGADASPDATPIDFGEDLSSALVPIATQNTVPALAAFATDDMGFLGAGVTGVRKYGDPTRVTIDDKWHLGSDTKAMTATLIALSVEAGELSWDATLPELFPGMTIDPGYQAVTLPMLLGHLGGTGTNFPADAWAALAQSGSTRASRLAAITMVLGRPPIATVGTYEYSNTAFVVAAAALERRANASWEDLIRSRLFVPLGMNHCGFGAMASDTTIDQPWGHSLENGVIVPGNGDNPPALGPAGTVHCPLAEWAAFLREHLRGSLGESTTLPLSAATWTRLHTNPSQEMYGYGYGWSITAGPWTNGVAYGHSGSNGRNRAIVWFAPGVKRVYGAMTNMGGDTASDAAITMMIERFRP